MVRAKGVAVTTAAQDALLVKSASEKLSKGEKPSREEQAAVRRKERAESDDTRRSVCSAIPKAAWLEWGNITHAQLKSQIVSHGFPGNDKTIDVLEVARWLHAKLATIDPRAGSDDYKGRLLQARAEKAETEVKQLREQLIHRREVGEFFRLVGGMYRQLSRDLQQRFGPAVADMTNERLDDIEQEVMRRLEEAA